VSLSVIIRAPITSPYSSNVSCNCCSVTAHATLPTKIVRSVSLDSSDASVLAFLLAGFVSALASSSLLDSSLSLSSSELLLSESSLSDDSSAALFFTLVTAAAATVSASTSSSADSSEESDSESDLEASSSLDSESELSFLTSAFSSVSEALSDEDSSDSDESELSCSACFFASSSAFFFSSSSRACSAFFADYNDGTCVSCFVVTRASCGVYTLYICIWWRYCSPIYSFSLTQCIVNPYLLLTLLLFHIR